MSLRWVAALLVAPAMLGMFGCGSSEEEDFGPLPGMTLRLTDMPRGSKKSPEGRIVPRCPAYRALRRVPQRKFDSPQFETRYGLVEESYVIFPDQRLARAELALVQSRKNQRCLIRSMRRSLRQVGASSGSVTVHSSHPNPDFAQLKFIIPIEVPILGRSILYSKLSMSLRKAKGWLLVVVSKGVPVPPSFERHLLARAMQRSLT